MKWLLSLTSLVAALLVAEQVVRAVQPAPSVFRFLLGGKESAYQLSANPVLGYELKANVRSDRPDCHNTFDYTNAFGQRDREREIPNAEHKRRIILLGDSVVAGHGLCTMDKTISQQLERILGSELAEVLNFGVGGYCTRGEVELLKTKGLQFQPNEVLLLFVNNDYVNSNGAIVNQISSQRPPLLEWAFRKSHIVRWFCLQNDIAGFRRDFDPAQRATANQSAVGSSNIADGIELLSQLAVQHNFKPRILLWPYFTDRGIEEPWPPKEPQAGGILPVERLAEQHGIPTYRLSNYFAHDFERISANPESSRARKRTPRGTYTIGDGIHPSVRGAQIAAEAIANLIRSAN